MMETVSMAVRSLRAHLLRSGLTLLGIVIGITAVVGMSAIIRGVDEVIMGSIRVLNPHVVYLTKFGLVTSEEQWLKVIKRPDITYEDLRAIEADCPSVWKADLFIEGREELARGTSRTRGCAVMGVGPNYLDVGSRTIQSGRYFAPGEISAAARVMVLGKDPADALFAGVDPVGKSVRVAGQEYTVVGTFAPLGEVGGMGMGQDNLCAIPHTAHRRDLSRQRESLTLAMVPREGVTLDRMMEEVTAVMRVRHRLRGNQDADFDLITQASVLKLWRDLSGAIFLGLIGISSIALLVGGIGVMAVMMVAVTERTREIGVRRAVGARRGHILAQFLAEAIVLTTSGGGLGSALGALVAWGLGAALHLPVSTPWDTFALAVGTSTVIGLVFGVMPAWRAARFDVVEALRSE